MLTKPSKPLVSKPLGRLLAVIAGGLYPLGFAPFGFFSASLLSLAIYFYLIHDQSLKPALLLSALFGLAAFGVGVSWVYVSMVTFGNMIPAMAVIAVILFVGLLAIFPVLATLVHKIVFASVPPRLSILMIAPALWVLAEWLRGWVLTGFPWLSTGYSAIDTSLSAYAPVLGVTGLSAMVAFIAGALAAFRYRLSLVFVVLVVAVFAIPLIPQVKHISWTQASGNSLRVAAVQLNISLADKWRAGQAAVIRQAYLSESAAIEDVDLIVWPEGAIPQAINSLPIDYIDAMQSLPADILWGGVEVGSDGASDGQSDGQQFYNSAVLLNQDGTQFYRKQHLVPFGDYFPLQWLLAGLMESLQIPMSDFSAWQEDQLPLSSHGVPLQLTICYEDAFPVDWRHLTHASEVLVNISEDAWFGDSFAPHQRLEMARMRSMETGRPMVRVSNSGLSTFIGADGEIEQIAPQFEPAILRQKVNGMTGKTPYMRFGEWPTLAFLALVLFIAYIRRERSL